MAVVSPQALTAAGITFPMRWQMTLHGEPCYVFTFFSHGDKAAVCQASNQPWDCTGEGEVGEQTYDSRQFKRAFLGVRNFWNTQLEIVCVPRDLFKKVF